VVPSVHPSPTVPRQVPDRSFPAFRGPKEEDLLVRIALRLGLRELDHGLESSN